MPPARSRNAARPASCVVSQRDRARGRTIEAAQHVERGRLACAVGADQSGHRRGRHVKARSLTARTPPNVIDESSDLKGARGLHGRAPRSAAVATLVRLIGARARARPRARRASGRCVVAPARRPRPGAAHSTTSNSPPKNSSRYSSRLASSSGSSPTIPRQRPDRKRARAADHHHEHEQDRLQERERARRDEPGQRREEAARQSGQRGRTRERDGLDPQRIEPDRLRGRRRCRAPPASPRPMCRADPGEQHQRTAAGGDGDDRRRSVRCRQSRERGTRQVHEAVLSAGESAQLDRAMLDDEAERDGDHRQVRALTRSAGCASR